MVAVAALVRDTSGRVLLQKRVDHRIKEAHEKWEFPGGKIDFWETPVEAIVRECKEEIGCDIEIKRLLPVIQSKIWKGKDARLYHVVLLSFEAQIVHGKPTPCDVKVSEVRWVKREDVAKYDTLEGIDELVGLV